MPQTVEEWNHSVMQRLSLSRKERMAYDASLLGLTVRTYSPGDGVTRYRFFTGTGVDGYFSGDGLHTALGLKEAETFLAGYGARR